MTMPTLPSPTFTTPRTDREQPVVDLSSAPLPTARTLRRRKSLPTQLVRFVAFSTRIMRMVAGGHS